MARSDGGIARPWLYAGTILVTAVALAVSLVTQRISATPSYAVFVAAVAVAARFGGKGPAIFASAISLVLIDYFIIPPTGIIDFRQPEQAVNIVVFAGVASIITSMTTLLRQAEREARERAASLARANEALEEQMEEVRALDESLHEANEHLTEARDASARLANGALRLQSGTDALSKAMTVAEVGNVALDGIATLAPMSRGVVYLLRGDCLTVLAAKGDGAATARSVDLTNQSAEHTSDPIVKSALTGEAVWLEPQVGKSTTGHRARAWPYHVSLPLRSGEAVIGVVSLDASVPPPLAGAERSLIQLFAHAVASAMVRARQYDAERGGREAAESLARAREEVLAIVAHDLRNPLALVGTSTEMIAELGDDLPRRREMIEIVRRAVKRMNGLIADLLDITRLQAGHLALEQESIVVSDVFKQVAQAWTRSLAEEDVVLHVVFPRTELRVQADPSRLSQVLDNLLGNAQKFTPPGGRVVVRADVDGNRQIRFCVSDNGPGIAPEAVTRLFDRFWQARRSDRRGIGMGLAICKGIVEAHGGRIWCDSTPGAGAKFYFTIPAPAAAVRVARSDLRVARGG